MDSSADTAAAPRQQAGAPLGRLLATPLPKPRRVSMAMPTLRGAVDRIERRFGPHDGPLAPAPKDVLAEARRALSPGGGGVGALGRRALKAVPHLLWGPDSLPLDRAVVREYLARVDREWRRAPQRLWYHHVLHIGPSDALSLELGAWLAPRQAALTEAARAASSRHALLDPPRALAALAGAVCEGRQPVADIAAAGVGAEALRRSRLAVSVVAAAAESMASRPPCDPSPMEALGDFLGARLGDVLREADCTAEERDSAAAAVVEAAVRWCRGVGEDRETVQRTLDFVVGLVGDPRRRSRDRPWGHPRISAGTRESVERWLSARTMEAFFHVVDATLRLSGDRDDKRMWAERRDFWLRYLPEVRKAWLICAQTAALEAAKLTVSFGRFTGTGVQASHCGLLLEIGAATGHRLAVLEMNHDGAAIFWRPGSGGFPDAYEDSYDRAAIRGEAHSGRVAGATTRSHAHSWRSRFRDLIASETGIDKPH